VGSLSVCYNCSSNCLNCSSASNCTLCDSLTILDISNNSCTPNCSLVTNCTTCYISSSTVICQTCLLGYVVNASNMCATFCGDGIIIGIEVCDDNNSISGDGCSSVCAVETSFYCTGTPSVCQPCSIYCTTCSSPTNCSLCNILAILDTTNNSCSTNCTIVPSCMSCSILNVNLASQYLQCSNCTTGYLLNYGANICNTICGDGLILGTEACDDNNLLNGDGCSSTCSIEPAFYCSGAPSICGPCLQYC
jgi:cysteine-rich repeat protein